MRERSSNPESGTSWTGGTRACGFEIKIDRARAMLRFVFSGFWDLELGIAFRDAAIASIREIAKTNRPWVVLADISKYPAQKPEVQECHATAMNFSSTVPNFRGAANLVDNTLSQMQIRRLSQQSGLPTFSFFQNENDAIAWLEKALGGA